ncbi:ABC transporter permease [Timonella sp. A28]|uniref:ABC transporter permease n=1 Tax=Timonella sp. A28 TaxID=3442640 RepID=UPI003EB6FD23
MHNRPATRTLITHILEQDRLKIVPFIALGVMLSVSSILGYKYVLPDTADRENLAQTIMANPAFNVIFGQAHDLTTIDGFNAWRTLALGSMFTALMAIFLVIRNTRGAEETGQAELIAALPIARTARLKAALISAVIASLAVGVIVFTISVLVGGDVHATALISAGYATSGIMFAGIAALAAQTASLTPTATTLSLTLLGGAYALRGYADGSADHTWLIWVTPLGWIQETQPAHLNRVWPLGLCLLLAAATYATALLIERRRDYAGAALTQRPGPEHAHNSQYLPVFLTRLNAPTFLGWTISLALLGYLFGNIGITIGETLSKNPTMARVIASGAVTENELTAAFISMILSMLGMLAGLAGISVLTRLYREETSHRLENVLSGAVTRTRYLAYTVLIALTSSALAILAAGGVIAFVSRGGQADVSSSDVIAQTAASIPAIWVLVALGILGVTAHSNAHWLGWLGVVVAFSVTMFGPMFQAPQWVMNISPFEHVPLMAAPSPDYTPLIGLGIVGVVLIAVSFIRFSHRDLA